MPRIKEEEGTSRSSRGRGEEQQSAGSIPSRVKGRVALRSDRGGFRRSLRGRKGGVKDEDMMELGPARRKPGRKRKRSAPSPPDSPSDDRTASSSSSWAGHDAKAPAGKSSNAGTPTSRAAGTPGRGGEAGGFRNDLVEEEEFQSPGVTWPYLEPPNCGDEEAGEERRSGPPPHPLINKIRMTKQLQSLYARLFELADPDSDQGAKVFEADTGLVAVKAAVLERVANYHYKSFYAFRSDFDNLMRKHCINTASGRKELVKRELTDLLGKYKALCEGKEGVDPVQHHPYTTLSHLRQKLCDDLLSSGVSLRKPVDLGSPPPVFTSPVYRPGGGGRQGGGKEDGSGKDKVKKKRQHGLGKGKKPARVPYKTDARVLVSESEDEEDDFTIEPLLIARQPPELFIAGMYATKDTHFEVEVCVPEAMRRRMRLESAVPLVVELRYEGGDPVDQQPLQVLEEPLMYPGQDRWVVRAKINATSYKHGKRKFALWLDVSQFEQRSHNLWVQGVLTDGINVVSSMAQPVKKRKRRVEA